MPIGTAENSISQINIQPGQKGMKLYGGNLTLASGSRTVDYKLQHVDHVDITEVGDGSAASGDTYNYLWDDATKNLAIVSSNASSTAEVSIRVYGW